MMRRPVPTPTAHLLARAGDLLAELELLVARPPRSIRELYDRAAVYYDDFRALWLRLAGGEAEEAMLEDLRAVLEPGSRVLDAGCGTGAAAREILALQPRVALTLLDVSPGMLERTRGLPGCRVLGNVLDLPFLDDEFDVVVSAWVIETLPDPVRAVQEFLRVITSDGYVFFTFSSLPEGLLSRAGTAWLRRIVESRFGGTFLPPERTPWHDCERSHRVSTRGGLATEIALRKCCRVGPDILPSAAANGGRAAGG